jgi:hypothetical protein
MDRIAVARDVWLARRMTLAEMSRCLDRCLRRDHADCGVQTCDRYRRLIHWHVLLEAHRDAVPCCGTSDPRRGAGERLRAQFIEMVDDEAIELSPEDRGMVAARLRRDLERLTRSLIVGRDRSA